MGRKRQEWRIDEWDDSLDSGQPKPKDPFSIPGESASSEWDWPEDPVQPVKSKGNTSGRASGRKGGRLPGWLIPSIAGGCAVILLIIFGLSQLTGGGLLSGTPGPSDGQVFPVDPAGITDSPVPEPQEPWTTAPAAITTEPLAPTPTPKPSPATPTPAPATPTPAPTPTPTPKPASVLDRNEWYGKDLRARYNLLTDHEKELYEQVYDGLMHFSSTIRTSTFTDTEIEHVTYALNFDTPELFQWEGGYRYTASSVMPEYRMSQSEYQAVCDHIHGVIEKLQQEMPAGAGEYEQEVIINTYLVDHCTYLRAGDSSSAFADASLYKGRSQCSGYSRGLILLLRAFGIECVAQSSNTHEWDLARINGRWYHVDSTWNDLEQEDDRVGNRYFCWMNVPDRLVTDADHMRKEDGFPYPACTSIEDNYAVREGIYMAPNTSNPAKVLHDQAEQARNTGKNGVIVLVDDPAIVNDWDSIWNSFYHEYNGYGWVIYPPKDTQTVFMYWEDK